MPRTQDSLKAFNRYPLWALRRDLFLLSSQDQVVVEDAVLGGEAAAEDEAEDSPHFHA